MKMKLDGVMLWFCNWCGYSWRVWREAAPPERCAACRTRRWQAERDDAAEL